MVKVSVYYGRNHITLYENDLKKLMHIGVTLDEFKKRVHSWLWDEAADEDVLEYVNLSSSSLEREIKASFDELFKEFSKGVTKADMDAYNEEQKKNAAISKIMDYPNIINPVVNHFYEKFDLWHRGELSRYSSRYDVANKLGYNHADKMLKDEFIPNHCFELVKLDKESIKAELMKAFENYLNEFKKTFDYDEWRKKQTFWW